MALGEKRVVGLVGATIRLKAPSVLDGQKYCKIWGAFLQSFVSPRPVVPLTWVPSLLLLLG